MGRSGWEMPQWAPSLAESMPTARPSVPRPRPYAETLREQNLPSHIVVGDREVVERLNPGVEKRAMI